MQFYSFGFILLLCATLGESLIVKPIHSGCMAYDCKRTCYGASAIPTPGDNGFKVVLENTMHKKYKPNMEYNISIIGNRLRTTTVEFNGFLLAAVPESWYDAMPFNPLGKFKVMTNDRDVKYTAGCNDMVTHKNFESKSKITVSWMAPPAGSGCVSFKATVLQYEDTLWFKDDGALSFTFCEDDAVTSSVEIPQCCACGEAKYSMTFKGLWSRQTHPKDWPQHEYLTHWSNLIGAVHSRNFTVWEYGGYATEGLKELAVYGIIRTLEDELKNHSKLIRTVIITKPFGYSEKDSDGAVYNIKASADRRAHLLSIVTKFMPTPDWFTGVSKLNLCLPNCTWVDSITDDLYPFDAGVDSGISYTSPDRPTIPQEKIHKLTNMFPNNPKSPFYDPTGKPMQPVARLIIKQNLLRGAQCPNGRKNPIDERMTNQVDFNLHDLTDPITRDRVLNDEGAPKKKSGKGKGEVKILDKVDPRCMMLDWTSWSECSATCGSGIRRRSRQYKDVKQAMGVCSELLEDTEICTGSSEECESGGDNNAFDIADMCLMVTSWSFWSPCSVTCGTGTTIRIRQYIKPEYAEKCSTNLREVKDCKPPEAKNSKCKDEKKISNDEKMKICSLEKLPGPCKMIGNANATRYYHDLEMKKCMPFEYGGCKGNKNNFMSMDECEKFCHGVFDPAMSKGPKMDDKAIENKKRMCMLPKEEGSCFDSIPRYYFDRTKLTCAPLEYSGCDGNENNFQTFTECVSACHPFIESIKQDLEEDETHMKSVNQHLTIIEKKKICMSPEKVGDCDERIPRYWYSVTAGKCILFHWSGCGENLNNFESIEECEKVCDVLIDMTKAAIENEQKQDEELNKKEMCMQPKEIGPCTSYMEKYYFDTQTGKCTKFMFGGCNPNENNFDTLANCKSTCSSLIDMTMKLNDQKISMEAQLAMQERHKTCELPVEEGTCAGHHIRYYYNKVSYKCEQFPYTGCNGNMNNYLTSEECKRKCGDYEMYSRSAEDQIEMSKSMRMDCMLSDWSDWTECSSTECGKKGKSTRSREIKMHPKNGGEECPKKLNETRFCYKKCNNGAPLDCIVSQWGPWSECKLIPKLQCEGVQERERALVRREQAGGMECPKLKEKRKCVIGRCNSAKKVILN